MPYGLFYVCDKVEKSFCYPVWDNQLPAKPERVKMKVNMTLLIIPETAMRLRTSPAEVRRIIKNDKDFPCYAYNRKSFCIVVENLDKWVMNQAVKTKKMILPCRKKKAAEATATPAATGINA